MQIPLPTKGYLKIKVITKSSKNEISDVMTNPDGEKIYKIRIKSAPVEGKANAELIKFLSKELSIPQGSIEIIKGGTSKIKLIKIS